MRFVQTRLTLRHLRVLHAVAQHGSVSRAAEFLHVSQPAVSKALAEIESGIGQPVLLRTGRHVRFSRIGMRIVEVAKRVDADLARGGAELRSLVHGASGEVIVGATNDALIGLLPPVIAAVKARNPHLKVTVRSHGALELFDALHRAHVDVVVARIREDERLNDFHGHELMPLSDRLVASRRHPDGTLKRAGWDTLNRKTWVLPQAQSRTRPLVERFWASKGLPTPSDVVESSDAAFIGSLMRKMPVLAFASQSVAARYAAEGLVEILPHPVKLGLSTLQRWTLPGPQTPAVDDFCAELDARARALASQAALLAGDQHSLERAAAATSAEPCGS